MPPSAMASKTISASFKPDCGRASRLFSIMIPVTGRAATSGATVRPLKGAVAVAGVGLGLVEGLGVGLTLLSFELEELCSRIINHQPAKPPAKTKIARPAASSSFFLDFLGFSVCGLSVVLSSSISFDSSCAWAMGGGPKSRSMASRGGICGRYGPAGPTFGSRLVFGVSPDVF